MHRSAFYLVGKVSQNLVPLRSRTLLTHGCLPSTVAKGVRLADLLDVSDLLVNSMLAYHAPADVLLDKVQLGFDLLLPTVRAAAADNFGARLFRTGVLSAPPRRGTTLRRPLSLGPFSVPLTEGGMGQVRGQIALAMGAGDHLVITRRSYLAINAMRDLRTQLIDPGDKASNGDDNLVWPHDVEWKHLLGLHLVNVAAMFDALLSGISRAADVSPTRLRGTVWVQQCEVCRDFFEPNAEALVRELASRPIPGSEVVAVRRQTIRRRNAVCVAWGRDTRNAAENKVYAKRHDLLRTEVSVRSRPAVKALLARGGQAAPASADVGGSAVAQLLENLVRAAAPLLDRVSEVAGACKVVPLCSTADFVSGFAPLTRLSAHGARPAGAGGRPRHLSIPVRARRALVCLLASGTFNARGHGASDAILLALRQMAETGLLVAPGRGSRLFNVSPG